MAVPRLKDPFNPHYPGQSDVISKRTCLGRYKPPFNPHYPGQSDVIDYMELGNHSEFFFQSPLSGSIGCNAVKNARACRACGFQSPLSGSIGCNRHRGRNSRRRAGDFQSPLSGSIGCNIDLSMYSQAFGISNFQALSNFERTLFFSQIYFLH